MIALCGFAIKNKPAQDVGGFKRCLCGRFNTASFNTGGLM